MAYCLSLWLSFSQSPSLLISGFGSLPQRKGRLSTAARQIYRRNFPPVAFIQSWTVLLMRCQSILITPHEMWLELFWLKFNWTVYFCGLYFHFCFIACTQIQSFSVCFIFLRLSTLPRLDFPGTHGLKKHYRLVCFKRAHFKVFVFLCFLSWCMQTFQRAQKVWRLNSQISQDGTFVYYPFFVLNILLFTLFTFSYLNFFLLFVCFDTRWQLVTTHACNNTPDRDAILRAKMTSLDAIFRRGNKSSSSSLAHFYRRKHKKSTAQALRSWKNLS